MSAAISIRDVTDLKVRSTAVSQMAWIKKVVPGETVSVGYAPAVGWFGLASCDVRAWNKRAKFELVDLLVDDRPQLVATAVPMPVEVFNSLFNPNCLSISRCKTKMIFKFKNVGKIPTRLDFRISGYEHAELS